MIIGPSSSAQLHLNQIYEVFTTGTFEVPRFPSFHTPVLKTLIKNNQWTIRHRPPSEFDPPEYLIPNSNEKGRCFIYYRQNSQTKSLPFNITRTRTVQSLADQLIGNFNLYQGEFIPKLASEMDVTPSDFISNEPVDPKNQVARVQQTVLDICNFLTRD
jgi:hypothetical protein